MSGLPAWMVEDADYEPAHDRDGYLRANVLRLAETLTVFRAERADGFLDAHLLAQVSAPLRLGGLVVAVLLVSLSQNAAFVWTMLALSLLMLAMRPARTCARILAPTVAATVVAALVNLPAALFFGQAASAVRIASKTFVSLCLTCSLAQTVPPEKLLARLGLLPDTFRLSIALAIRDLALIGQEAKTLSEALELRSVGRSSGKDRGVTGVLGTCFLRGMRHAATQAEAMELRGFDGTLAKGAHDRFGLGDAIYLTAIASVVILFVYLELSL